LPRIHEPTVLEMVLTAYPKSIGEEATMPEDYGKPRSTPPRRLVALCSDPALTKALQELATSDTVISIVTDMRALSDELMQNSTAIALLDAAAMDAPLDAAVDAITTQFPDLRLMVAGQGSEQTMLATRISNQTVFRFVHKPASPQRLKLFLDAALRPAETQRGTAYSTEPASADGALSLAKIETAVHGKSPQSLAIIGVVAIAAIAAGAWVFWPKGDNSTANQTTTPAISPVATNSAPQITTLINKADQAFAAGKYVASNGGSAAELYRAALKVDGKNAAARSGYDRSIEFGLRSAEETLLSGKLSDAAALAEMLRLLAPGNSRLAFLNTQIEKEQGRVNSDASLRQAFEAKQSAIRASLAQMSDRVKRGALIEPATNSALTYFREAEALGAGDPGVRSARETLVAALLTAADTELSARKPPAARRLVDAASTLNSSAAGLDVLRRRADEVATQIVSTNAAAAAAAPQPAVAPAVVVPVPAAPAPAIAVDTASAVVSATTLRNLRKASPEFPQRALDQLISGWVEMEFTVARDGSVTDIIVVDSEPRRTFDAAAMAALRRYRYAPVIRNGEPVAQRARLRMRFTAQDAGR
jgi:protein TonB